MSNSKSAKTESTKNAEGLEILSPYARKDHPNFHYNRPHWKNDGPRVGIEDAIRKKLKPNGHEAFWYDVLLPNSASGRLKQLDYLLASYDALPPRDKTALVDYKLVLDPDASWCGDWEMAREWARHEFVEKLSLVVVMIHHVPELAGSANAPHIHTLILPRKLSRNGFGGHVYPMGMDDAYKESMASWLAWIERAEIASVQ